MLSSLGKWWAWKALGLRLVWISGLLFALFSGMAHAQEATPTALVHGLASFVLPGFGQVLNAEYDKAITHFLVDVLLWAATGYVGYLLPPQALVLVPLAWHLYSAYDAYTVALQKGTSPLRF